MSNIIHFFDKYFIFDSLSILFFVIMVIVCAGVGVYNYSYFKTIQKPQKFQIRYLIASIFFILAMTGSIFSNHLGISWVFIEATTLTSAYLIYFQGTKHSLEATWKYVFICSVGIALAFVGIILLLSGAEGESSLTISLFYNDLYANADKINPLWLKLSFLFVLVGFGTKIGLAPVHTWLPDAHSEASSPVSAMLSATLLNSAFIILIRFHKLMELADLSQYANTFLFLMGFLSVFVAAVFIFKSTNYKRMLAYSSIENMGIATIGIAIGGIGFYAAMLQLFGHSLIKAAFFLTSGNILNLYDSKNICCVNGIINKHKITGWLWVSCFIGISGIPPSPLFISKFLLIKELFTRDKLFLAIILLVLMVIILYGMGKVIIEMSFGEESKQSKEVIAKPVYALMYIPQVMLLLIAVIIGVTGL